MSTTTAAATVWASRGEMHPSRVAAVYERLAEALSREARDSGYEVTGTPVITARPDTSGGRVAVHAVIQVNPINR